MPFEKGNKYGNRNGRPRGAKNKASLQNVDWTADEIKDVKEGIMELVRKRHPQILSKFLDKMEANKLFIAEITGGEDDELNFKGWS